MSEATAAVRAETGICPSSVAVTCGMAIFLLLNALVLNGVLWLASPARYQETVLQHSLEVLRGNGMDDSWGAMAIALEHFEEGSPEPIYRAVFFGLNTKFQYPPSSLFALMAMRWATPDRVRLDETGTYPWPTINDAVGWLFILLTAAATAALLEIRLRQTCGYSDARALVALRVAIVAGLTLTFYPVVKAFTLGQIQVWINALFAVALLCWVLSRRAVSGVLMGIVCLIKPHFALFVVWALIRKEWRFAFACAATGGVGLVASIAVFGFANHLDYLPVLSHLAERGEAYYPNHSINGLLNRLISISDPQAYNNLDWRSSFPPFNRLVYWVTTISSAAILLLALARRYRAGNENRVADFCTMAVSCTIASPIAWEHHYGVLLPIFAVVFASALRHRAWLPWLVASYVLASNYFIATQALAPTVWNVAQSYLLFGAWILLVLLHLRSPSPLALAGPPLHDRIAAPAARSNSAQPAPATPLVPSRA